MGLKSKVSYFTFPEVKALLEKEHITLWLRSNCSSNICCVNKKISPSLIRSARASALKPANTTLCAAPMRAQANMDATAKGQVGM